MLWWALLKYAVVLAQNVTTSQPLPVIDLLLDWSLATFCIVEDIIGTNILVPETRREQGTKGGLVLRPRPKQMFSVGKMVLFSEIGGTRLLSDDERVRGIRRRDLQFFIDLQTTNYANLGSEAVRGIEKFNKCFELFEVFSPENPLPDVLLGTRPFYFGPPFAHLH